MPKIWILKMEASHSKTPQAGDERRGMLYAAYKLQQEELEAIEWP